MSKKTLISIIILLTLTILSLWVFFFDSSGKKIKVDNEKTPIAKTNQDEKVKVSDLIITETNQGKKFWEVIATTGNYDKQLDKVTLKNIKGNFYKDNIVVLSVEAPMAIYDSVKKEVTLKNGARAANNKNIYITAREICWSGTNDKITATGNVRISQNDKMLTTSDKSIFNTSFTYLKLNGHSNSYVYR